MMAGGQGGAGVERMRRTPRAADDRERLAGEQPRRREPSMVDAVPELQHAAGNRGVASALGGVVVQRQPKTGRKNDGGSLRLGGEKEIPIQSATWSLKNALKPVQSGESKSETLEPAGSKV